MRGVQERETKVDREISQLINKLSTSETEEVKLDAQVTTQQKLIEEYYKNEESIQLNKQTRSEIVDVRANLDSVKEDIKKLNFASFLNVNQST